MESESTDKTTGKLVVIFPRHELDAMRAAAAAEGEVTSVWVRARLREALARARKAAK